MKILWKYLQPQRNMVFLSLLLAAVAQLLNLIDPLIFGKIIDEYAVNKGGRTEQQLVQGVLKWLVLPLLLPYWQG